MAGLRVVRAVHWNHGNEDGGEGHLGTVTCMNEDQSAEVVWDNGNQSTCSIGKGGKYELKIFDNAPVGIRHIKVDCSRCKEHGILGMRFKCKQCEDYNLCPICYVTEEKHITHEFLRFETPDCEGDTMKKRSSSQKIRSMGLFPGATVVRGIYWDDSRYSGAGKRGEILSVDSSSTSSSARDVVKVKWENGNTSLCRVGADGKVDVQTVDNTPGFYYYEEHLPDLGKESENFHVTVNENDKVFINMSVDQFEKRQKEHGSWSDNMFNCHGKVGVIKGFTPSEDAVVEFDGVRFTLYPGLLQKVPDISEGDVVRVLTDETLVKKLQKSHGGWCSEMSKILGKCGRVEDIHEDADLAIKFGNNYFLLNAACCVPTPDSDPDDILYSDDSDDDLDDSSDDDVTDSSEDDEHFHEQLIVQLARMFSVLEETRNISSKLSEEKVIQAAAAGKQDIVQQALSEDPDMANMRFKGLTLLTVAAHEGHVELVKLLLENGASLDEPDDNGNTPLMVAIRGKKEATVKLLLDAGANVKTSNKQQIPAFHYAVLVGESMNKILPELLKKGCDVNSQDAYGNTPLHVAIIKSNNDAVKMLCRVPSINFKFFNKNGFSPLQLAVRSNNVFAVETILQRDISTVHIPKDNDGYYALNIAAINNHTECAELLIDMGKADLNVRENNGSTSLHLACSQAYFNMVKLLIEKGAEKDLKDKFGNTALHFAVISTEGIEVIDRIQIAHYLIKKNVDYNIRNKEGKTPLDIATPFIRISIKSLIEEIEGKSEQAADEDFALFPCMLCLKTMSDTTFLPCGHCVVCKNCCRLVRRCPKCYEYIRTKMSQDQVVEDTCIVQ